MKLQYVICINRTSKFVKDGKFDYDKLGDITKIVTRNLNEVINRISIQYLKQETAICVIDLLE